MADTKNTEGPWSTKDTDWVRKHRTELGPVVRYVPRLRVAITEADLFAGYGVGVKYA